MRVAQVCPPDTSVGAAWVQSRVVGLQVGCNVASEDGGGDRAVHCKQMLEALARRVDISFQVGRAVCAKVVPVVSHGHDSRRSILPLDTVARRGESNSLQHSAAPSARGVPDEICVRRPHPQRRCLLAALFDGERHRGCLARGVWVGCSKQIPKLCVYRRRRCHRHVRVALFGATGACGVCGLDVTQPRPHAPHERARHHL
mmetsp:Transcript_70690/g.140103  ORF Transcript_70690/g.140103 Transcript_70690/m.140103 type:complete len:201 (+) Transcript_70690:123-725(+)